MTVNNNIIPERKIQSSRILNQGGTKRRKFITNLVDEKIAALLINIREETSIQHPELRSNEILQVSLRNVSAGLGIKIEETVDRIIRRPNLFQEEFVIAAFKHAIGGKLKISVSKWVNKGATPLLLKLVRSIQENGSCDANLVAVVEYYFSRSSWASLSKDERHLEAAINAAQGSIEKAKKFVNLYFIDQAAAVELGLALNHSSSDLLECAVIRKKREIEALTAFIKRFGNDSSEIFDLIEHLRNYPFRIEILCKLFTWTVEGLVGDFWTDFILSPGKNSIRFLDLAHKLKDSSKGINYLVCFIDECELVEMLPALQNIPVEWLGNTIRNLQTIHQQSPKLLEAIITEAFSSNDFFILCVVGRLASHPDMFDCHELENILTVLNEKDFPKAQLKNFLSYFPRELLQKENGLGDAIYFLLQSDANEFCYLLENFGFHPFAALKQIMRELNNLHQDFVFNKLAAYLREKKLSFDDDIQVKIWKTITKIDDLSASFLGHINDLMALDRDKLAYQLLELWNSDTIRNDIEQLAEAAVCRSIPDLVERLLETYKKGNVSSLNSLLKHACVELPKEVVNALFQLNDAPKSPLLLRCIDEYERNQYLSTDLQTLVIAHENNAAIVENLLIYTSPQFKPVTNVHLYIQMALTYGEFELAIFLDQNAAAYENHLPMPPQIMLVKSSMKSGLPIVSIQALINHYSSEVFYSNLEALNSMMKPSEERYNAILNLTTLTLAHACLLPGNVIQWNTANRLLYSLRLKGSLPPHLLSEIQTQLDLLKNNKLRDQIEKLQFTGNQNGNFAHLIRYSMGLPRNVPIQNNHLIGFTLMTLLAGSRQPDETGSCVGVSLLNNLIFNRPEDLVTFISQLATKDHVTAKNNDAIFLPLLPPQSILDNKISEPLQHYHQMPGVKALARYCGIADWKISEWVTMALTNIREKENITHYMLLEALVRSYLNNMNGLSSLYSMFYSASQQTVETNNEMTQFRLAYLSGLQPLHQRALESLLISFDNTKLKVIRQALYSLFAKHVANGFTSCQHDDCVNTAKINFIDSLNRIGVMFDQHPSGKLIVIDTKSANSLKLVAVDNPNKLHKMFEECAKESLKKAKESPHVDWEDSYKAVLEDIKKSNFESQISTKFNQSLSAKKIGRIFPWNLEEGAYTEKTWKRSALHSSSGRIQNFQLRGADQLFALLIGYIKRHQGKNEKRYISANLYKHAVNINLNHPSLEGLQNAPDVDAYINDHIIHQAKQAHAKTISAKEMLNWALQINDNLPVKLQAEWQEKIERQIELLPDTITLGNARNIFIERLISICGSADVVSKNYERYVDEQMIIYLDETYLNSATLHFFDSNWMDIDEDDLNSIALFYNPCTFEWEMWETSGEKPYYKYFKHQFCGDKANFSIFVK